ncbi:hypothetical protein GCM10027051_16340 [Niabella terrae]
MDMQKLIDYIPAILLLISIMTIILIVITKFGDKFFDSNFKTDNALIFVASFLFIIILITHLFKEQPWTADTLKIIIGVLVGSGASKLSKTKKEDDKGNSQTLTGNEIKDSIVNQALGDINQKIDNFKSEVSKIEHAVVNQFPTIEQKLDLINNNSLKPQIKKTEHLRLETDDFELKDELKQIFDDYRNDDYTWKWIQKCMAYPEFDRKIKDKIQDLETQGWKIISMNFDNISNGIHINFDMEKPYV